MPPAGRGGRGGARGGRGGGAFNPARGTVTIAGTELNWDLTGLDIQKGPAERFPVSPLTSLISLMIPIHMPPVCALFKARVAFHIPTAIASSPSTGHIVSLSMSS